MNHSVLQQTLIGADYLRSRRAYPIDTLLDYLSGLWKLKIEDQAIPLATNEYDKEIAATKEILRLQTARGKWA